MEELKAKLLKEVEEALKNATPEQIYIALKFVKSMVKE